MKRVVQEFVIDPMGDQFAFAPVPCLCGRYKGPQTVAVESSESSSGGFCAAWSLLMMTLQVAQPSQDPTTLMDTLMLAIPRMDLRRKIRQFTFMTERMVPERITKQQNAELLLLVDTYNLQGAQVATSYDELVRDNSSCTVM